jgi:SNF2 family DNA or RNA helicase
MIRNLFPSAPLDAEGRLVIPHGIAETTILRRLGMAVPAPVNHHYQYTGNRTPFAVQKTTVEMLTMNQRAYVLSGMGVGKTACPLWAYDFLRQQGQVQKMLIVAPLSTLEFVWVAEMLKIMSPYKAVVLHGDRAKRLKLLSEDADIYIINHDGVKVVYEELLKRADIDTLVIDELAVYRNNTGRSKRMKVLAARMKFAWGMTGSPAPHAPTDVWQQANILTPNTIPKYFTQFRHQTMVKVSNFLWVPKKDAHEHAYSVLQPSVRFTLEDVGELPGYISRIVDVPLGPQQKRIYNEIRKDGLALLTGGDIISPINKGVLENKLLQISLGYVYIGDRVAVLDNQARIDAILDILDSTDEQVLIFGAYKHAIHAFHEAITRAGHTAAVVTSDTPARERAIIFNGFQNERAHRVIVGHPGCMAHGLTLTAASIVIWPGPINSLEIYDQANARVRRTGQSKKQLFLHLCGTPAERHRYAALTSAQDQQNKLLDMFEEELL